ncbi:MAG: Fic family protein [Bacteroidetes bacterium]|nr:Fic family protein [Bacteroidota bacterium]
MFKPNFKITPKMLNYLTDIAVNRAKVLDTPLIRKWEEDFRKEAIIEMSHASTAIEGNRLYKEQVASLFLGRHIDALFKDTQEVINYFNALKYINEFKQTATKTPLITNETILNLHKLITDKVMRKPDQSGRYRKNKENVCVVNSLTGKVVFRPPETKEVPKLMNELLEWLNSDDIIELNSILKAGLVHYEFVRIHPFIDGNGRTARALAYLVLFRDGFDPKRFFYLDDYYWNERPKYYATLNTIDPKTLDLTGWLEYICCGASLSIYSMREKMELLRGNKEKQVTNKQVLMKERHVKTVEYLKRYGTGTNSALQEYFNVSSNTVYRIFEELMKRGIVKRIGKGRDTCYVLRKTTS